MYAPHRILVPIDFSPCSMAALAYAAFMAEHDGSVLHVLHVDTHIHGAAALEHLAQQEIHLRERVDAYLALVHSSMRNATHTSVVNHPDPVEAIRDAITRGQYDMVIMGAWGAGQEGACQETRLGHVATYVAHTAPCQVEHVRCATAPIRAGSLPFSRQAIPALANGINAGR